VILARHTPDLVVPISAVCESYGVTVHQLRLPAGPLACQRVPL
jgi:hypothetical protein